LRSKPFKQKKTDYTLWSNICSSGPTWPQLECSNNRQMECVFTLNDHNRPSTKRNGEQNLGGTNSNPHKLTHTHTEGLRVVHCSFSIDAIWWYHEVKWVFHRAICSSALRGLLLRQPCGKTHTQTLQQKRHSSDTRTRFALNLTMTHHFND